MVDNAKPTPYERALLLLLLAVSLALRLTGLSVFVTSDEDRWYFRSVAFEEALQQHDWASTYQSGHPGVLTMWLGAIAERAEFLQQPLPLDGRSEFVQGTEPAPGAGVPPLTLGARRLVALVSWLGVVALYPLLRRLLGARTALLATAFVALDPFFLAHSRLHHLDALLTTFSTLSIVCLLVYQFAGRRPVFLAASAAAAGLAVANKSPGIVLAPWAALALLAPAVFSPSPKRRSELLRAVGALAAWGLIALLAFTAVWPAMWVNPLKTLQDVFGVARYYAENPHENSNFFWFAARPDPGAAFYPIAWAFRATPWAILGLIALPAGRSRAQDRLRLLLAALGALAFTAAMTLGAKKFDRYLLPVFPLLDIVAAAGWVALLRRLEPRLTLRWKQAAPALGLAFLAGTQLLWVAATCPYYLSYYNPALGGGKAATRMLLTGWGEGLDRIAAYLNQRPDASELVVCSWPRPEFDYFFLGRAVKNSVPVHLAELDYCIFYQSALQRDRVPPASRFMGVLEPEYVVSLNGINYAWLYENTLYDQAEQEILARLAVEGDPEQDMLLLDIEPTFARTYQGPLPLEVYKPGARLDAIQMDLQRLTAGRRRVWRIVYPAEPLNEAALMVAEQLEQQATVGQVIEAEGVQAIAYDLPPEPHFVPEKPTNPCDVRFGDSITLVGYDVESATLVPGEPLQIRFHWQIDRPLERDYVIFIHVIGPEEAKYGQLDAMPHDWMYPTSAWPSNERILDDYRVDLSADAPAGGYVVVVGMYDRETRDRLSIYDPNGNRLANDVLILGGFSVPDQSGP